MKIDLGQGVCATPWAGSLPEQGEQSGLSSINRVSQWPFFFVSVCLAPTRQTKPSWTGGFFSLLLPKGTTVWLAMVNWRRLRLIVNSTVS
jgi:hypothetical protein